MGRIILQGKAGSGKDFAREQLITLGYRPSISYTSRPPRPNEVDGREYHFITEQKFEDYISEGFFYEENRFGKAVSEGGPGLWWYGTPKHSFDDCTLFIMTPSAMPKLSEKHRKTSVVIYFDIPEVIRYARLKTRKDVDNAERRMETDREDFKNFIDFDIRITDHLFKLEDVVKKIEDYNVQLV